MLLLLAGCQQTNHKSKETTRQIPSDEKVSVFVFDEQVISRHIHHFADSESSKIEADRQTATYYKGDLKSLLWMDYMGVSVNADSLLQYLQQVEELGMTRQAFYVEEIERDLKKIRHLEIGTGENDLNLVVARLEYHLTKACLRYVYGQRFGFIRPQSIFNGLDVEKEDDHHNVLRYRGLFNMHMDRPDGDYARRVIRKIESDSIVDYLSEIQPQDRFYLQLKGMLPKASSETERQRIICNMERSRWRLQRPIPETGKRIIVNVPAFHLYAYGADTVLDMRVVCGAVATKTPLLDSQMEWMEVNPQWIIPMSIVEKDVVRHVGDTAYFARNRYQIFERATNKQLDVSEVSSEMLLSGKYRVAQQSGSGNSLGRIVFRFKNPYSVYLHYTSNPSAFRREVRAISHGCVRVERPFELAEFLLDNPDEWLLDRIRISMDLPPMTERGHKYLLAHQEETEHKLIGYVPVKPHVPLYIIYYTLWPDEHDALQTWPDVYGYDKVILQHLKPYLP